MQGGLSGACPPIIPQGFCIRRITIDIKPEIMQIIHQIVGIKTSEVSETSEVSS